LAEDAVGLLVWEVEEDRVRFDGAFLRAAGFGFGHCGASRCCQVHCGGLGDGIATVALLYWS
jgi:hypothetical protein